MFASKMQNFNDKFNQLLVENDNNNLTKLMILVRFPGIKLNLNIRIRYAIDVIYYFYNLNKTNDFETDQINKLVMFIDNKIEHTFVINKEWENTKNYIEKCEYNIEIQRINDESFEYNCDCCDDVYDNYYEDEENEESFY